MNITRKSQAACGASGDQGLLCIFVPDHPPGHSWEIEPVPPWPRTGTTPQGSLLRHAMDLVENDRQSVYGPPHEDFAKTVGQLNALGYRGPGGRELLPRDWAVMMVACKQSRLMNSPHHYDSFLDGAGYYGCYAECVQAEEETAYQPGG